MSQQQTSAKKNETFFLDHHQSYKDKIASLETYQNIFREVTAAIGRADLLIDIGNGGVFDYDTTCVKKIVAVDLMFTNDFDKSTLPENADAILGSALELPFPADHAALALMNMLLHHLTGHDVESTTSNLVRAISEAARILQPGGTLVVMESCVPEWFFRIEKLIYKPSIKLIELASEHPATLQFPPKLIADLLRRFFHSVTLKRVPKGRWVLQYGKMWPSILTPAQPYLFIAKKA